ncbi:MAG TPA: FliI/YscN family ATPase [Acidobacteriaceae bacterium]|nr:FliI/YscN family ATPase [Acidobacteriaceae bacterium]
MPNADKTQGAGGWEMLGRYARELASRPAWRWHGRVVEAVGQVVKSEGPFCTLGECCEILDDSGQRHAGEVIGFRGNQVLTMPIDRIGAIHYGNAVAALGTRPQIGVGQALRGRVLNAMGKAIDGFPAPRVTESWALDRPVLSAMDRLPIEEPIGTGVRAIDGLLTTGCGQRVGIFGGSGVGKSTLIGVMTRNTSADVTVVGLIGERGREVREFLEDSLGERGREKSVVVVSTSDESPLLRIRAALAATAIAEYYAEQGSNVLLVIDSLTRYAMAEREIGLAAGEPPTAKGYTPSVFAKLARLVERAGRTQKGSVTAFYTVLMEGDDQQDPIVDAARSLLDGHIILSRALASEGRYPPIAVLDSVSRLMTAVASAEHRRSASQMRRLLAAHSQSEDLVRIGAYRSGSDPELDLALRVMPKVRGFLEQGSEEVVPFAECVAALQKLPLGGIE